MFINLAKCLKLLISFSFWQDSQGTRVSSHPKIRSICCVISVVSVIARVRKISKASLYTYARKYVRQTFSLVQATTAVWMHEGV